VSVRVARHAVGVDYVLLHGTAQSTAGTFPHVSSPDLLAEILELSGA
jgi:hypothetical protein